MNNEVTGARTNSPENYSNYEGFFRTDREDQNSPFIPAAMTSIFLNGPIDLRNKMVDHITSNFTPAIVDHVMNDLSIVQCLLSEVQAEKQQGEKGRYTQFFDKIRIEIEARLKANSFEADPGQKPVIKSKKQRKKDAAALRRAQNGQKTP